jgi:peptidoglycan/xylan/chitin deacetylase (PgdA/CDA1 family)
MSTSSLLHAGDNLLLRHVLSPRIRVRPSRPIVSFTFDDIPLSAALTGAALLEQMGVRGTFYIAGGLATQDREKGFADTEALQRLAAAGHELACHTFSHRGLRAMSTAAGADDLARNAAFFESMLPGFKPSNFAYPFNKGTIGGLSALRSRYRSARGGHGGINRGSVPAFQLSAVEIGQPEDADLTRWLDDAVADPGWLIYFTHDVSATPSPYGARPETLERLVARALDLGCEVLTIDAALDRLSAPQRPPAA